MRKINDNAIAYAPNGRIHFMGHTMRLLKELFTTDVGLMSAAGIVFMIGMAVFFVRYFVSRMHEDEAREKAAGR